MKGFGRKDNNKKNSTDKIVKNLEKDRLISNAFSLHSRGKIKEAAEIYNFLIGNKIYDPRILNNLGSIFFQLKQFNKAILLFEESIKRFPNSLETYPNLANVLIISDKDSMKNINKSARNIKNVKLIKDEGTNIYDLFKYRNVIITSSSAKKIQERVLNEKN